jgi:hypothetical protein
MDDMEYKYLFWVILAAIIGIAIVWFLILKIFLFIMNKYFRKGDIERQYLNYENNNSIPANHPWSHMPDRIGGPNDPWRYKNKY